MLFDNAIAKLSIVVWVIVALVLLGSLALTLRQDGLFAAIGRVFSLRTIMFFIVPAIAITVLSNSLVFISPQQIGVVISLIQSGGSRDQPLRSGLHWIAPLLERAVIYPLSKQTYAMSSKPSEETKQSNNGVSARTSDGQAVTIDCAVIFQIDPDQLNVIYIDWQENYIENFISPVTQAIVRTQVSQYTADQINSSKRIDLEKTLNEEVGREYKAKGFLLDRFLLRDIAFSPEYASSIEQKQVALQEITQRQNQAEQTRKIAEGDAARIRALAQAEADAIKVKAQAEAAALALIARALNDDQSLLQYNYIQKLAPNIRVMLLPNNTPYILPAADLLEPPTALPTAPISATGALSSTTAPIAPATATPTASP
jgi:regulator of protease activity HflC (stomatin/prohibitin superfamily)